MTVPQSTRFRFWLSIHDWPEKAWHWVYFEKLRTTKGHTAHIDAIAARKRENVDNFEIKYSQIDTGIKFNSIPLIAHIEIEEGEREKGN